MKQIRFFFLIYFLFVSYPVGSTEQPTPTIPIIVKGYVEAIKKQQQTLEDIESLEQKGIIQTTEISDLKKEIQEKIATLLFKTLDEIEDLEQKELEGLERKKLESLKQDEFEDLEQKNKIVKQSFLHMKRNVREEIVFLLKYPEVLEKFRERIMEWPSQNPGF